MKELSFNVSQFPFNQIKCETAAIRQGAVVVPMGQLEIILSVQAIFTTHAFQQSPRVTGGVFRRSGYDGYQLLLLALPLVSPVWHVRQVGKSVVECVCRWTPRLPPGPRSVRPSLGRTACAPDTRSDASKNGSPVVWQFEAQLNFYGF